MLGLYNWTSWFEGLLDTKKLVWPVTSVLIGLFLMTAVKDLSYDVALRRGPRVPDRHDHYINPAVASIASDCNHPQVRVSSIMACNSN